MKTRLAIAPSAGLRYDGSGANGGREQGLVPADRPRPQKRTTEPMKKMMQRVVLGGLALAAAMTPAFGHGGKICYNSIH